MNNAIFRSIGRPCRVALTVALYRLEAAQKPLVVGMVLLLSACSTTPGPPFGPRTDIPDNATVAVISRGVEEDLRARFNRDSTARGAGGGAAGGAAAGAAAAVFCGPFFFLCALGTIPAGALVGTVTGAAAGAVVDAEKKPSNEELETLNKQLEALAKTRTVHEEIRTALAARVPVNRQAKGSTADALVEISLGDIRFEQDSTGGYRWMLRVNLAAQWNRNTRKPRGGAEHYTVQGAALPISMWIDRDGAAIEAELEALINLMAQSIEEDLFL